MKVILFIKYNFDMSNVRIYVISIAAIIVCVLIAIIILIIIRNKKKASAKKYEDIISKEFDEVSLHMVETKLKRIVAIARNNKKYKDSCSIFENKYDKIYDKYKNLKDKSQEFLATNTNMTKSENSRTIKRLKRDFSIIKKLIDDFVSSLNVMLEAEKFLREEINYYHERYKMIKQFYQQIIVSIQPINEPLMKLNNKIIGLNKKFEDYYDKGEVKECAFTLTKYRNAILLLASILNDAKIIGDIIYNQIPLLIDKLVRHFKVATKNLNSSLKYINFISAIKKIRDQYVLLMAEYSRLEMDSCKSKIIWIFKNIKSLESLINDEIRAEHSINSYYKVFLSETENILKNYVVINKQIKILIRNNQVGKEEISLLQQMKTLVTEIDNWSITLRENHNNDAIPFVSKKHKLQLIFKLEISLLEIMNELLIKISEAKNFVLNFSNQLKYVSLIITELNAQINSMGIQLTTKEKNALEEVDMKIYSLEKEIHNSNVDHTHIDNEFKDIQKKIGWIHEIIAAKKESATIVRDLLTHFASKRKFNLHFNQKMNSAEKEYCSGEYLRALNTIIVGIEKVK